MSPCSKLRVVVVTGGSLPYSLHPGFDPQNTSLPISVVSLFHQPVNSVLFAVSAVSCTNIWKRWGKSTLMRFSIRGLVSRDRLVVLIVTTSSTSGLTFIITVLPQATSIYAHWLPFKFSALFRVYSGAVSADKHDLVQVVLFIGFLLFKEYCTQVTECPISQLQFYEKVGRRMLW